MSESAFQKELLKRIENYRSSVRAVERRLQELNDELTTLLDRQQSAEKVYEAEFGPISSAPRPRFIEENPTDEVPRDYPPAGPLTGLSWEEAMTSVIKEAGRPMHVSEILQSLLAGGFRTESKNPSNSIVTIAVRSDDLVKVGPNVYGLVDQQTPPPEQTALSDGLAEQGG